MEELQQEGLAWGLVRHQRLVLRRGMRELLGCGG